MYDVEKLISIVIDILENESEAKKHNREIRQKRDLNATDCIWVSSLDGSTAYRLGGLSERRDEGWRQLGNICELLGIDEKSLVGTVKSMLRWEKHNGRWDRKTSVTCWIGYNDKERLQQFLESKYRLKWYQSTGREMK